MLSSYNVGLQNCYQVIYIEMLYLHGGETDEELQLLSDISVELIFNFIRPIGILLTTLPIGPHLPGVQAGPSFETFRLGGHPLPHRYSGWIIIHERLVELADFCASLKPYEAVSPDLAAVESNLRRLASRMQPHLDLDAKDTPLPS